MTTNSKSTPVLNTLLERIEKCNEKIKNLHFDLLLQEIEIRNKQYQNIEKS